MERERKQMIKQHWANSPASGAQSFVTTPKKELTLSAHLSEYKESAKRAGSHTEVGSGSSSDQQNFIPALIFSMSSWQDILEHINPIKPS